MAIKNVLSNIQINDSSESSKPTGMSVLTAGNVLARDDHSPEIFIIDNGPAWKGFIDVPDAGSSSA